MALRPTKKQTNMFPARPASVFPVETLRGPGFNAAMAQRSYQNILADQIARLLIAEQQAQFMNPVPAKLPTKAQMPTPPPANLPTKAQMPTPPAPTLPTKSQVPKPPVFNIPTKDQMPKPPMYNIPTKAQMPKPPAYNPPTSPQPMRMGSPRGIG